MVQDDCHAEGPNSGFSFGERMVRQDIIRKPDCKETKIRANTNFQSSHMKLSPFLFCAYRTDMTDMFDRQALMRGWPMQQLPLTCLALLSMHNKS